MKKTNFCKNEGGGVGGGGGGPTILLSEFTIDFLALGLEVKSDNHCLSLKSRFTMYRRRVSGYK